MNLVHIDWAIYRFHTDYYSVDDDVVVDVNMFCCDCFLGEVKSD